MDYRCEIDDTQIISVSLALQILGMVAEEGHLSMLNLPWRLRWHPEKIPCVTQ